LWLANSITLTPGTLTVDVKGQTLQVHWIDVAPGADLVHATREIAEKFENVLKGMVR
jgi:multicomponent Na+:H+ antiporter subunit E